MLALLFYGNKSQECCFKNSTEIKYRLSKREEQQQQNVSSCLWICLYSGKSI